MKSKIFIIALLSLFSNRIISQTNENINPKGNWFFGVEIGINKISSFSNEASKSSFQGGFLSEYYFARHWSLSARIKYYETGVSFYKPDTHGGSWIDFGSDESYGSFNGAVICVPIDVKWEFRIYKNLGGSLKIGAAYTMESKSNYGNYSANLQPIDYPNQYGSINSGYGLNYFINKKLAVYLDFEYYSGDSKGFSDNLLGRRSYNVENNLVNFAVKYNFKKDKAIN